jgi:hypothetical protein
MTVGNGKKRSQIKFLVVVNLFVNTASHKTLISTVEPLLLLPPPPPRPPPVLLTKL